MEKVIELTPVAKMSTPWVEPAPPTQHEKAAGHHWLTEITHEGKEEGNVVLQWNPSSRRWTHSGDVGTRRFIPTFGWKYVAPCPMPY